MTSWGKWWSNFMRDCVMETSNRWFRMRTSMVIAESAILNSRGSIKNVSVRVRLVFIKLRDWSFTNPVLIYTVLVTLVNSWSMLSLQVRTKKNLNSAVEFLFPWKRSWVQTIGSSFQGRLQYEWYETGFSH